MASCSTTIDLDLMNRQAIHRAHKARQVSTYLNADGTIKGLTRRRRERPGRRAEDDFHIQVWDNHLGKQLRATRSVLEYGEHQAFHLALAQWIEFRGMEVGGLLHQALKAQFSAYTEAKAAPETEAAPVAADDLEAALLAEAQAFQERKRAGVIRGRE